MFNKNLTQEYQNVITFPKRNNFTVCDTFSDILFMFQPNPKKK